MERSILFSTKMVQAILEGRKSQTRRVVKQNISDDGKWEKEPKPSFRVGDKLWVRETFCDIGYKYDSRKICFKADTDLCDRPCCPTFDKATKWHPSIFMPRWASRITLVITDVRVERLQDISESDAEAEGVDSVKELDQIKMTTAKTRYQILWNSINGKTYPWESNPWVWCVSFKQEAN